MSDTPRTDAVKCEWSEAYATDCPDCHDAMKLHAQQLERELAAMEKDKAGLVEALKRAYKEMRNDYVEEVWGRNLDYITNALKQHGGEQS
jgi:hypothetical protein